MPTAKLPHIFLANTPESIIYTTSKQAIIKTPAILRDRQSHGELLQRCFDQAWEASENERAVSHSTRNGTYLEFISDPNTQLIIKSLENLRSKKTRLLNVRKKTKKVLNAGGVLEDEITTYATVYVANEDKRFFANRIEEYLTKESDGGSPKHESLITSIAYIRKALLVDSFWCDPEAAPPQEQAIWIEVWLSNDNANVIASFDRLLTDAEIQSRPGVLYFPERSVKVILANHAQLEWLSIHSSHIAEYRKAKTTAHFFTNLSTYDQAEWSIHLLNRLQVQEDSTSVVCILDTGVNRGHPLLESLLHEASCLTVDAEWGVHDHNSHGTLMAGIAAYGNLMEKFETNAQVLQRHKLESVKLLPPPPGHNEPDLWGYLTSQAISRAEIQAPDKVRCVCLAVTSPDSRDRGKPTSWSAQLDQITSGADDGIRRLVVVSAGNACAGNVIDAGKHYPDIQLTDSVHDPAQAWNVLTVGACTSMINITNPVLKGYTPVAPAGGLSPFSTTSSTWDDNQWPVKPELVLEGGNLAIDKSGFVTECDDLSMLSTYYEPQSAHFYPFNMTSAATAKLSWMAGQLQASYPEYWPETHRALLVHSASWTNTLKEQFLTDESKGAYKDLLEICGYGVPDLERAIYSANNSLTLIAQNSLQPFDRRETGSGYRTRDMHMHELPWPMDALLRLPDNTSISMRVTLSYFVEPGPGEIGWKDRYRYPSHGLRFDLNSPGESKNEFMKRINKAAREEDEGNPTTSSPSHHWLLGANSRNRGSIHSDIWRGTAQELARSNLIAVTPTIGWWRERTHLKRWDKKTRYALIVSIHTPDESIDVYTPVAIQLGIAPPIDIPTR